MEKASTAVAPGFAWIASDDWRGIVAEALTPVATHVFTTRDLSFTNDATDDWTRLGKFFGSTPDRIVRVRQVHGRAVFVATPGQHAKDDVAADAIIALDPSLVVTVRVADCVPVLVADRSRPLVAAIHAGWRGTCAGIVGATLEAIEALGSRPEDLLAVIGPSAGPCCYQVDEKVRTSFLGVTSDAAAWFAEDGPGHWKLDLWQATVDQLVSGGVPRHAISSAGYCTIDHPETCFSYRRDGAGTGRLVAAIRAKAGRDART